MMKKAIGSHRQRGVAAVEFGILLIPLVLLTFGITEYGRAMYQYNALAKSTRNAARYLSEYAAGTEIANATDLAIYGCIRGVSCTGTPTPLVPGLSAGNVQIADMKSSPTTQASQDTGSGLVNLVTVTITGYQFQSLVPTLIPDITFSDISVTMRQVK